MQDSGWRKPAAKKPANLLTRLGNTLAGAGGARSALAGLIVLASAVALVWLGQGGPAGGGPSGPARGGAADAAFRLLVNGSAVEGDTLAARAGDTLQLVLSAREPRSYAVLFREDHGRLAVHVPPEARGAAGNADGERLPGRLVLGSGWESFDLYAVSSRQAFSLPEAEGAVESREPGKPEEGRHGLRVQTFHLRRAVP